MRLLLASMMAVAADAASRRAVTACLELGLPVDAAAALGRAHGPRARAVFEGDPYADPYIDRYFCFMESDMYLVPENLKRLVYMRARLVKPYAKCGQSAHPHAPGWEGRN